VNDMSAGPQAPSLSVRTCATGMSWRWDGVDFEVLHPDPGFRPLGNDSSCVLKITAAGGSLLVLGDVERRGERAVAAHPGASADVVVVAHHGSATSSTPVLVEAADARLALVSAAHRNQWNFPRPEVVQRWEAAGAHLRSTAEGGALHVTLGEGDLEVWGERDRRRRYWGAE
jgi:competence protein ComEC